MGRESGSQGIRTERGKKRTMGSGAEEVEEVDTYSAGRHQVLGKKWKSLGNSFSIRLMFRASKSLRQISLIPGK